MYVHSGNLELAGLSSTFAPGYLLLKEGASLYANGNAVSLDYVAVERKYDNAGWQLAAVPYTLQRAGIERVAYEGTTYAPRSLAEDDTTAYYDGRGRAESLTRYAESNSLFWKVKDSFAAGEGFGLRLSEAGLRGAERPSIPRTTPIRPYRLPSTILPRSRKTGRPVSPIRKTWAGISSEFLIWSLLMI